MPASSGDGVVNITASLKASLGVGRGKFAESTKSSAAALDEQLFATNKQVLLSKLEFEKAPQDSNFQLNQLRNKYTSMNPQDTDVAQKSKPPVLNGHIVGNGKTSPSNSSSAKPCTADVSKDAFPVPKRMLYSPERVCNKWEISRRPAVGLVNMGNTCFLNSVIQCLSHTAPLYNYLMSRQHTDVCTLAGFCLLCELERHFRRAFDNNHPNGAIKPVSILQRLKCIAKHFHWGRQEDAHEFLRYVIDCMQKCALHEHKHIQKIDPATKNTTVVHQIFGGYLRSQVLCMRCKGKSNTYDPFLDISLDIKVAPSVERALEKYVAAEVLGNENAYKCERCNMKVPIQKRFTIHQAPNILTLQLKRFEYHKYPPSKLSKPVNFAEKLNIRPYMSQRSGEPVMYHLYAVLQHFGLSTNSGHYLCHVRAPNGTWYTMNDSQVTMSSIQRVLNSEAYLLFYVKVSDGDRLSPGKPMKQSVSSNGTRPPMQGQPKRIETKTNGSSGLSQDDIGTVVTRKPLIGPQLPRDNGSREGNRPVPKPSTIPLLGHREKIAFGIKPATSGATKEVKEEPSKPRIVMHIKQGKVAFNSVATAGSSGKKIAVNGKDPLASSKLVPYQDDESSSEDESNISPVSNSAKRHFDHNTVAQSKKEQVTMASASKGCPEPVLDQSLNATLTVPGAYKPLDQEIKKLDLGSAKRDKSFEIRSPVISPTKEFRLFKEAKTCSPQRLTVVTSPVPGNNKVNSTTPWNVLDQDAQASPSLASGSSNASVNSTTDWQVYGQGEGRKPVLVPEAQCPGWKVTPKNLTDAKHIFRTISPDAGDSLSLCGRTSLFGNSGAKSTGDSAHIGPSSYLDVDLGKVGNRVFTKLRRSRSDSNIAGHKTDTIVKYGESNDSGFVSDDLDSKSEKSSNSNSKLLSGDDNPSPESNITTDSGCPKSNNSPTSSGPNSSVSSSPDLNLQEDVDEASHHKKHKKKKHKKHKHKDLDSSEEKHKKKKKKKHKRKHEDRDSTLSSDSSDSPKKRKISISDVPSESAGGEEYEWIEKTKETLHKVDQDETCSPKAPVQDWDHHTKAVQEPEKEEMPIKTKTEVSWDGSKSSSTVVAELEKSSLNNGYGAQVGAWDGGRSHFDQEVQKERAQERKRQWSDDYEAEMDMGKSKKMKRHADSGYSKPVFNQFQKFQDRNNKAEDFRRKGGWFPVDRNRDRFDYGDRNNYHYNNNFRNGGNYGYQRHYQNYRGHGPRGGPRGYHHGSNYYGNRYQGNNRGFHRFH